MINNFKGEHSWASNFSLHGFWYDNIWFPSNEHFFAAMKTLNREHRIAISKAAKSWIAKRMGSPNGYKGFKIELRDDWNEIRDDVMLYGLRKKISNHPFIARKLVATYPEQLIEGNWWHDNYWGDCSCQRCKNIPGLNKLGKLWEKVRLELINKPQGTPTYTTNKRYMPKSQWNR